MQVQPRYTRTVALAALLSLPVILTGCGGGGASASTSAPAPSSTSSSAVPTPSSTATPDTTSSSAPSSSSSSDTSTSGDTAGKPSKADATKGLTKILRTSKLGAKIPEAKLNEVSTCVVDKTYGTLTVKTLKAMATGDSKSDPDDSDGPKFAAAVTFCAQSAGVTGLQTSTPAS